MRSAILRASALAEVGRFNHSGTRYSLPRCKITLKCPSTGLPPRVLLTAVCENFLGSFSLSFIPMRCSFERSLPFLFLALTSTLSVPSSLTLTTPSWSDTNAPLSLAAPNSTGRNTSFNRLFSNSNSRAGLTCSVDQGQGMSIASCRNAWQKILRTFEEQWFVPRPREPEKAAYNDVVLPIRYLSDDGICAIVRGTCFAYFLYLISYEYYKAGQTCNRDR